MKYLLRKVAPLFAAALIAQHAEAQVVAPLPGDLEGPIDAVTLGTNGALTIQALGMTVNVPNGTPISSPAGPLTRAQLADPTPFPGRTLGGFVGTVVIITGIVDPATGLITASDVLVDPVHNTALGVVTGNTAGQLTVNNVPVTLLTDPRLRGSVKNAFGFEIVPASIPVGSPVAVEGYFANGALQAFLVEVEIGGQLTTPNPQIAILRAQTRERTPNNQRGDEVEVRGSVTTAHAPNATTQTVRIFRVDNGVQRLIGTTTATVDPAFPGFASFIFRGTTAPSNNALLGTVPTVIRARNISPGARNATITVQADVRP